MKFARTKFHLQTVNAKGEITIVQKHQALDTLARPTDQARQVAVDSMDMKLVTGYHLCLDGKASEFIFSRIEHGELKEYIYRLPDWEYAWTRRMSFTSKCLA